MPVIERSASAAWHGTLKEGHGEVSSESKVLNDAPYTFVTRFEQGQGTNPEELLAAAQAACYSMALANTLSQKEFTVHYIKTVTTCHLDRGPDGTSITKFSLIVHGKVLEISAQDFTEIATTMTQTCIASKALSAVKLELASATLD